MAAAHPSPSARAPGSPWRPLLPGVWPDLPACSLHHAPFPLSGVLPVGRSSLLGIPLCSPGDSFPAPLPWPMCPERTAPSLFSARLELLACPWLPRFLPARPNLPPMVVTSPWISVGNSRCPSLVLASQLPWALFRRRVLAASSSLLQLAGCAALLWCLGRAHPPLLPAHASRALASTPCRAPLRAQCRALSLYPRRLFPARQRALSARSALILITSSTWLVVVVASCVQQPWSVQSCPCCRPHSLPMSRLVHLVFDESPTRALSNGHAYAIWVDPDDLSSRSASLVLSSEAPVMFDPGGLQLVDIPCVVKRSREFG
jgi:hypothetical protein